MKITENFLKKILVDTEIISLKDFKLSLEEAKRREEALEKVIIEKGLISDYELGQLIADEIGFPVVNLRKIKIDKNVLNVVPEIVAKKQEIIVFERNKDGLKVAMTNPADIEIREFIEKKTGEKVIPYFATKNSVQESFKFYRKDIKEEFEDIVSKNIEDLKKAKNQTEPLPAIKTVDLILNSGYENRASDIHIEPYENKIIVRYRIDGVLHDVLILPKDVQDFLVSRIKIMARLRTDIHDTAQDGHFSFPAVNEKVDVRVSVVPIEEGEKIVMRILAEKSKKFDLKELGFFQRDLNIIKENLKKPWGMIISSGPTGCGKTTTLYAVLKILNNRDVNIMTIEDPIEYDIEGINQIQVNAKTKLTFSKGLRAIMSQDPNIIMVGEIRDAETAKLAVSAAMTGHLVLSTFHAIDAATVLTRLNDIGIEPYIISSTVNLVVAQRLVRKICPKCIESYEISVKKLESLLPEDLILKLTKTKKGNVCLFKGKGCPVCQKTGYLGRVGIFELLEITDPIKKLVMEKSNASQIRKEAIKAGMIPMIKDGIKKAENGLTTIEEIIKAVK